MKEVKENDFEFQIKRLVKKIKENYEEEIKNETCLSNWLWDNKSILGEEFYHLMDEYFNIDILDEETD